MSSAVLTRSLAHSLACGKGNDWMTILSVFFPIFDHSAFPVPPIWLDHSPALGKAPGALGQNQVILRHPIIYCPTSEGVSDVSKGANDRGRVKWAVRVSDRANGRASGPVLQSEFLVVPDHSDLVEAVGEGWWRDPYWYMLHWAVFIYKSVPLLYVTIV